MINLVQFYRLSSPQSVLSFHFLFHTGGAVSDLDNRPYHFDILELVDMIEAFGAVVLHGAHLFAAHRADLF